MSVIEVWGIGLLLDWLSTCLFVSISTLSLGALSVYH